MFFRTVSLGDSPRGLKLCCVPLAVIHAHGIAASTARGSLGQDGR